MLDRNSYSDEAFDCDESTCIGSVALSDLGSCLPSTLLHTSMRQIHAQRLLPNSRRKRLQHHLSNTSNLETDSIDGLLSFMSYDDDEDDAFTYTSSKQQEFDDTDLEHIMMKLRGGCGRVIDEEKNDVAEKEISDDLISIHLKALTITTSKKRKPGNGNNHDNVHESDDVSVMTYGTGLLGLECTDDEESDDDDDNNTAYAEVDEVMNRLNTLIRRSDNEYQPVSSGREFLLQMSKRGAYDYENAPHDASSKREWLAQLATQLLQIEEEENGMDDINTDSNDDFDAASVAMSVVEVYNHNVRLLQKEAELAAELLSNETFQTQVRTSKTTNTSIKMIQPKEFITESAQKSVNPSGLLHVGAPKKSHVAQNTAMFKTSTSSRRESDGEALASKHYHTPEPKIPSWLSQTSSLSNVVDAATKVPTKTRVTLISDCANRKATKEPTNIVTQSATKNGVTFKIPTSSRGSFESADAPKDTITTKHKVPSRPSQTSSSSNVRDTSTKVASEKLVNLNPTASKDRVTPTATKEYANIVIPSGFPPYPGHGPKWPWHPDSPRAPDGYRECYMLHMGEYYHKYMTYLKQRADDCIDASSKNAMSTNEEDVLRYALSSQATFNHFVPTSKPKTKSSMVAPSTTYGRARKNCGVPLVLPKIEEGSNSTSNSSKSNDQQSNKKKNVKGSPDATIVGKIHSKSNGKRGTIIVVTANEIDQKIKEGRKLQRQQLQMNKSLPVIDNDAVKQCQEKHRSENIRSSTDRRENAKTTEVDLMKPCGCTIM
jgi:hypothetical protein